MCRMGRASHWDQVFRCGIRVLWVGHFLKFCALLVYVLNDDLTCPRTHEDWCDSYLITWSMILKIDSELPFPSMVHSPRSFGRKRLEFAFISSQSSNFRSSSQENWNFTPQATLGSPLGTDVTEIRWYHTSSGDGWFFRNFHIWSSQRLSFRTSFVARYFD